MRESLVLVGFMGAGKSTVGRMAAQRLNAAFIDSDAVIEARAGKRISQIFAEDGEAAFRALERATIADLVREPDAVIATGGGAFVDPNTRELLNRTSVTAYLRAPFDVLWNRIAHGTERPLLSGDDPRGRLAALFESRIASYEQARIVVDATLPAPQVVEELLHKYHECTREQASK